MRRLLAGVLLALLLVAASGRQPCAAPVEPLEAAERSVTLLRQVDLQALAPAQRQALLVGVAEQLQGAGQPIRALDYLVRALDGAGTPPPEPLLQKIQELLAGLDRPALEQAVFLYPGTVVAERAQRLLAGPSADVAVAPIPVVPAIGVLLPLSGRYAPYGEMVQRGMELARSGTSLRLVYRDTAGAAAAAAHQIDELARDPQVLGVLGPLTSAAAGPAAEVANRAGLPLLLLSQREGVPATGNYLFRDALTASAQVRTLADYAVGAEGLRRFAILYPATRQGELFADLFRAAVELRGGVMVARQSYPDRALDLRSELQALAAAVKTGGGADALLLPDEARQIGQIFPQLAFSRLDQLQLLGTSAWNDPELVRLAGPQIEGAVFVDGFFAASPRPEVQDFVARFQAAYGAPPNLLAAQGYDAARIMLTLLARPGVHDRATLRQALAALRDFPGATGRTGFAPNGEAEKVLFLLQVQDGVVVQIN